MQKENETHLQKPDGALAIRDEHLSENLLEYIDKDSKKLQQVVGSAQLSQRSSSKQHLKP